MNSVVMLLVIVCQREASGMASQYCAVTCLTVEFFFFSFFFSHLHWLKFHNIMRYSEAESY